jgi:hypothetical protein
MRKNASCHRNERASSLRAQERIRRSIMDVSSTKHDIDKMATFFLISHPPNMTEDKNQRAKMAGFMFDSSRPRASILSTAISGGGDGDVPTVKGCKCWKRGVDEGRSSQLPRESEGQVLKMLVLRPSAAASIGFCW